MQLKRRVFSVLLVAVLTVGMFGGAKLSERTDGEAEESFLFNFQNKETIRFWYSDETMTEYINSAAVAFGDLYNVRVFPQLVSDNQYVEAINEAALYSEQMPDAYLISHDQLEKAYLSGLAARIQDEDQVVDAEHFSDAALQSVTYQGKYVAYPLYFETSALLYNETYLMEWAAQQAQKVEEEIPEDAEEAVDTGDVSDVGEDASEGTEASEIPLGLTQEEYMLYAIPASVNDMLSIADSFDLPEGVEGIFSWDVSDIFYNYYFVGNYLNVGGEAGDDHSLIDINNEQTRACLEIYKSLNQFFSIDTDDVSYDSVLQDFIDGKIVFTVATTDAVQKLETAKAEGTLLYDYGFARLPDPSGELQSRAMSVTEVVAVNGYSEHQELANRFAAFLVNEYADELYGWTGKVSANQMVNRSSGALDIFAEEYADSIPLPKLIATSNLWIQLEVLFSQVWNGADVETLLEELSAQIASQLQ